MTAPRFDRSDLELLVGIAASGSLIKAAQALHVHHATAFRRLADMERRAQTPLFERSPQGYAPTAAARALIEPAARVLAELNAFDARAMEAGTADAEPLRVTASDGLGTSFFPPLLKAFAERRPDIAIDVVIDNRLLNVSAREVDIALRPARQVSGDMVCRRVGTVGYTLYAAHDYVRAHGALDRSRPDFTDHAICRYHESIAYFTTAKWLDAHAQGARVAAVCNTLTGMQALAHAGLCIAALPCPAPSATATRASSRCFRRSPPWRRASGSACTSVCARCRGCVPSSTSSTPPSRKRRRGSRARAPRVASPHEGAGAA